MQVTIDVSTWTQTEKNYLQAAAVRLLYDFDNSFDGYGITARNGVIEILDSLSPPANLSTIWSESNLKAWITNSLAAMAAAAVVAQAEESAKQAEITASEFKDIKLADIDAKIDAISNLNQMKILLKKFVRFVIARN